MENSPIWFVHSLKDDHVAYGSMRGLIQPNSPIPVGKVEHDAEKHVGAFLRLGCHGNERKAESFCKEMEVGKLERM